jgi:ubiquinol-cytochrome c reductase cytochrome c1 subunit
MRAALAAAILALGLAGGPAGAAEEAPEPPAQNWSFEGPFGSYDRGQLRRGLKVYTTVCAGCHGLKHVSYRNLTEIGLTPAEARELAAQKKVKEIGPDGEPVERAAELKDAFVSPFANPQAAMAANNGALPPDLSLITKARSGGADYVAALLTGYSDPPKTWVDEAGKPRTLEGAQYYNAYFPGHVIAMAPPLNADGMVEYGKDDPKPTVQQMANDVSAFLSWAAEPTLEHRHRTGIKVILFLLLFTGLFFVIYRRTWRALH